MKNKIHNPGLSDAEAIASAQAYGRNAYQAKGQNGFWLFIKDLFSEPMSLLLLATAVLYFLMGKTNDGLFMGGAIMLVSGISLYQSARSRSALKALSQLTQPQAKVVRNGKQVFLPTEDLVVGDLLLLEEGATIPADATLEEAHDFTVSEAVLTGESMPVPKGTGGGDVLLYQGTHVFTGMAWATITAVGNQTRLGQIGSLMEDIPETKTPLQLQIGNFVKGMVAVGLAVFVAVWGINYYQSHDVYASLLQALTLAMSIVPEEIPVAFATFMALGASRLMKTGVLVKNTLTVETLGSATIICTDKTGTITENRMTLANVFVQATKKTEPSTKLSKEGREVLQMAMWASEPQPFDPMEKALHEAYENESEVDLRLRYDLVHEYPLGGKPPMMTHIFQEKGGTRVIAAKGALEAILPLSSLPEDTRNAIRKHAETLANEGYRILAVGEGILEGDIYPDKQEQLAFNFLGLMAFSDPPKANMEKVFTQFYQAGIELKIITGDSAATTATIAKQVGFKGAENSITGDEIMKMSERELSTSVKKIALFARMFPEAKLRVINALKEQGEVVAMTGDGVNDGPALKAATIGIAMGKRGSEIAKQAANIILVEDNFEAMVAAVSMGRRIYANLKKAIQYIISIHIPIILTVIIPLSLGWAYPSIFSPIHIIFFELIMGPTCSIIFENEPAEANLMKMKPRPFTKTFFAWHELTSSVAQGIVISAGILALYAWSINQGYSEITTRSMVFLALLISNISLTFINRSRFESVFASFRRKNNLIYFIAGLTIILILAIFGLEPLRNLFQVEGLTWAQTLICTATATIVTFWFETVKAWRRQTYKRLTRD